MDNLINNLLDFINEDNEDLLTTFNEFKQSINNSQNGINQNVIVNKHTNIAHSNVPAHNNLYLDTPHQNSAHRNSSGNNHGNSHSNGPTQSVCGPGGSWVNNACGWHNNLHDNSGGNWHSNANHGNIAYNQAHSNVAHSNAAAKNDGFNHTNAIPIRPQSYDMPEYFKGIVSLNMYSYDKDGTSDTYYKIEVKKQNSFQWVTLLDGKSETYSWNTLNPIYQGETSKDMNGTFMLRVTPYNKLNNDKVIQAGIPLEQNIILKQNISPTIKVENGDDFINFTFGPKVYNAATDKILTYTEQYHQDNLLITANIHDVDADNYIKAWAELVIDGKVVATKDVIWENNGSNVILSNRKTQKGYSAFTQNDLKNIAGTIDIKNVSVRIKAQDYMEANCINPCDTVVTQTQASNKAMNFVLDFVVPILNVPRPTEWTGKNVFTSRVIAQDYKIAWLYTPFCAYTIPPTDISIHFLDFHKNGSYQFTAVDIVGNKTEQTVVIDKFDKDAPDLDLTMKIYPQADMNAWKRNITMELNVSDIASGVKTVTVNGAPVPATNYEFEVNADKVTTIETKDNVGNTAKTFLHFYNSKNGESAYDVNKNAESNGVDQIAPEHHVSIDVGNTNHMGDWLKTIPLSVSSIDYNGKVTSFKFAGTVQNGLASINNANLEQPYLAESIDGNYYGSKTSIQFVNMDKTAPNLIIQDYQDSVYTQEVMLKFNKKDTGKDASGVDYIMITLPNGNKVKSYLDSYSVVENGVYKFELYDFAGNKSETQTLTFTKIDRVKPIVNAVQLNKDGWVGRAEIAFTTNDNLSGVSQVFVEKVGGEIKYPFAPNAKYTTKENGSYKVSAIDSAGNLSDEIIIEVTNVDMVAPTVTLEYASQAKGYVDSVDILITGNDSESGIKSIHLPTGQVIFKDKFTHTVTENGSYSYYVIDNAGNKSEVNSIPVTNIDTSGVKVTHTKTYDAKTQKVAIAFTMTDEESGVSKLISSNETIDLDGKKTETATVEVSSNGTYTFQIVNGINKITNYRVTVNECPGAGIDTFQITGVTDEAGTGSMLAEGSTLPNTSAGVYKNAVVSVQAITINTPDDVVFSLSGASSAYVLDNVKAERGSNSNEWNLIFTISDMSVSEAVIEVQAQAKTGTIYSKPKSVYIKVIRDADGQPTANIIG